MPMRAWLGFPGLRYRDSVLQRDELQRVELLLPGDSGVVDLDRITSRPKAVAAQ